MSDASAPPPANWYPDPGARHERRYWDGSKWTEHVFTKGVQSVDPLTPAPASSVTTTTPMAASVENAEAAPQTVAAQPVTPTKVGFFGARKTAEHAIEENARLQALIDQYGLRDVAGRDAVRQDLARQIAIANQELATAHAAVQASIAQRAAVDAEVVDLRTTAALQDLSIYDYEHPAESSVSLATELETLRSQIKQAATAGQATTATSNFTFNNSRAKGDKFDRDMSKLMLRSYNAEAENCVKTVRAGNLATAQKRLSTTVTQVQRLGTMIDLQITPYYHGLRLRELELASRHLQSPPS